MFRYYIDRWNDVVNLNLNVGMRAVGLLERLLSFETVSFWQWLQTNSRQRWDQASAHTHLAGELGTHTHTHTHENTHAHTHTHTHMHTHTHRGELFWCVLVREHKPTCQCADRDFCHGKRTAQHCSTHTQRRSDQKGEVPAQMSHPVTPGIFSLLHLFMPHRPTFKQQQVKVQNKNKPPKGTQSDSGVSC